MGNMQPVIFDMDGVIIDSEPVHIALESEFFAELGITLAPGEQESYMGTSGANMYALLKARHGVSRSVESLLETSRNRYMKILRSGDISLVEGAASLIRRLFDNGRPLAVASSSPHEQIDIVMERFDLGSFFICRISGDEVLQSKPHPEIFLKTAAALGVAPEECWVIEDTENGVKAAKSAGMTCIGLMSPNLGNQSLSAADYVINRLNEVEGLLNNRGAAAKLH